MRAWLRRLFHRAPQERTCARCRHFEDDPRKLEQASPGLSSLSSAYGSVRGGDGLCRHHRRYVSPGSTCGEFEGKK
jgi:hypothetical protein